ncbi:glycosyl transferase [Providencia alcalifaciens]
MFDVLIIPYRDLYFLSKFGPAVRDLQFIECIKKNNAIDKVTILNRPVSLYERFYNKYKKKFNSDCIDKTSYNLFGPLKKRAWTQHCYYSIVKKFINEYKEKEKKKKLLIIDFTPIAILPVEKDKNIFYWYDMIDNFKKHNCYTNKEKSLVNEKYKYVSLYYDFITGVSKEALNEITSISSIKNAILPNGVFMQSTQEKNINFNRFSEKHKYDFGFIGFITDKFDIDFVKKLSKNHKIIIYGKVLDQLVYNELNKEENITFKGAFQYTDLSSIMKTFEVGLLPYLESKSHDGSPLKLYEYLKYNIPCLTSIDYEYKSEYIINYNKDHDLMNNLSYLLDSSGNKNISESIPMKCFFKNNIDIIIENIKNEK